MDKFFLSDCPAPAVKGLDTVLGCHLVGSPISKSKYVAWLRGCWRVLKASGSDDVIICWFDFQAVLCWWLCKLTLRKRHIGAVNLMLKAKNTTINKTASFMYKKALAAKNFHASVTSVYYYEWLQQYLGIRFDAALIHDVYKPDYQTVNGGYGTCVFSGGGNARDWHLLMKLAKRMTDVNFLLVMHKGEYDYWKDKMPENVKLKYDIPRNDFLSDMANAAMVCLPLTTDAPAGLIAMFMAAGNDKYVIMSENMTTKEYITPDKGCLVSHDITEWESAIRHCLSHPNECMEKAKNLHRFLETECGEDAFLKGVEQLIEMC